MSGRSWKYKLHHNTIGLSCHEQVCLMRLHFRDTSPIIEDDVSQIVASLNILVHDVISVLCYEHWIDKQKYFYV